jgi:hypothetical protein
MNPFTKLTCISIIIVLTMPSPTSSRIASQRLFTNNKICNNSLINSYSGLIQTKRQPMPAPSFQQQQCNDEFSTSCCSNEEFNLINQLNFEKGKKFDFLYNTTLIFLNYMFVFEQEEFDALLKKFYSQNQLLFGLNKDVMQEYFITMKMDMPLTTSNVVKAMRSYRSISNFFKCSICDLDNQEFVSKPESIGVDQTIMMISEKQCKNLFINEETNESVFEIIQNMYLLMEKINYLIIPVADSLKIDWSDHYNEFNNVDDIQNMIDLVTDCQSDSYFKKNHQKCIEFCTSHVYFKYNPFQDLVFSLEFGMYVMSKYYTSLKKLDEIDQQYNTKYFKAISDYNFSVEDDNMPAFKCIFQLIVTDGLNICNSTVIVTEQEGFDFLKYQDSITHKDAMHHTPETRNTPKQNDLMRKLKKINKKISEVDLNKHAFLSVKIWVWVLFLIII